MITEKNKEVTEMKRPKKAAVSGAGRELQGKLRQLFMKQGFEVSVIHNDRMNVGRELNEKQDVIIAAGPDKSGITVQPFYGKKTDKNTLIPVFAVIPADYYNPAVLYDAPRWRGVEKANKKPEEVRFVMEKTEEILNNGLEGYFVLFIGYHCVPTAAAVQVLKKIA